MPKDIDKKNDKKNDDKTIIKDSKDNTVKLDLIPKLLKKD